jgi:hypothetical protein
MSFLNYGAKTFKLKGFETNIMPTSYGGICISFDYSIFASDNKKMLKDFIDFLFSNKDSLKPFIDEKYIKTHQNVIQEGCFPVKHIKFEVGNGFEISNREIKFRKKIVKYLDKKFGLISNDNCPHGTMIYWDCFLKNPFTITI